MKRSSLTVSCRFSDDEPHPATISGCWRQEDGILSDQRQALRGRLILSSLLQCFVEGECKRWELISSDERKHCSTGLRWRSLTGVILLEEAVITERRQLAAISAVHSNREA